MSSPESNDSTSSNGNPTWDAFIRVLRDAIFGTASQGKWSCLLEQVQMACLVGLLFSTGCKPGDFVASKTPKWRDHLCWGDLHFDLHRPENEGDPPRLTIDVTYRKSTCTSMVQWERTRGVLLKSDPDHCAAADPALLLAWMAVQDNAFRRFANLEDLTQIDFSALPEGKTSVGLQLRGEVVWQPVFRHYPETLVNLVRGLTVMAASKQLLKVRRHAGVPNVSLGSLSEDGHAAISLFRDSPEVARRLMPNEHQRPGWHGEWATPVTIDLTGLRWGPDEDIVRMREYHDTYYEAEVEDRIFARVTRPNVDGPAVMPGDGPSRHNLDALFLTGEGKVTQANLEAVLAPPAADA